MRIGELWQRCRLACRRAYVVVRTNERSLWARYRAWPEDPVDGSMAPLIPDADVILTMRWRIKWLRLTLRRRRASECVELVNACITAARYDYWMFRGAVWWRHSGKSRLLDYFEHGAGGQRFVRRFTDDDMIWFDIEHFDKTARQQGRVLR